MSVLSINTDKTAYLTMEDKLDVVIGTILVGTIGLILICSLAIPIAVQQIGSLSSITNITSSQVTQFGGLLGIVVIMLIVGLIIAVLRGYNGHGSR